MSQLIITRADEVQDTLRQRPVVAVLSIEHPGCVAGGKGAAPRLDGVPQKILCFWDSEEKVAGGPNAAQIKQGIAFVMEHLEHGDVLIHCHAGKARSTAIALGVLALQYPEKDETTLLNMLFDIRPVAAPNILIVSMVDELAGRDGRLIKVVLAHPVISAQRRQAEESRQAQLRKNPELAKKFHPEKFPKKFPQP